MRKIAMKPKFIFVLIIIEIMMVQRRYLFQSSFRIIKMKFTIENGGLPALMKILRMIWLNNYRFFYTFAGKWNIVVAVQNYEIGSYLCQITWKLGRSEIFEIRNCSYVRFDVIEEKYDHYKTLLIMHS